MWGILYWRWKVKSVIYFFYIALLYERIWYFLCPLIRPLLLFSFCWNFERYICYVQKTLQYGQGDLWESISLEAVSTVSGMIEIYITSGFVSSGYRGSANILFYLFHNPINCISSLKNELSMLKLWKMMYHMKINCLNGSGKSKSGKFFLL